MKKYIYSATKLKNEITIPEIFTIHYYEFSNDYRFSGESHDFWELVYVDSGSLFETVENAEHVLKEGDIILHKPGEWHSTRTDGKTAPSVIIITFSCHSDIMTKLSGRVHQACSAKRLLLSEIIKEYQNVFDSPLSELVTPKLHRKSETLFGAEQIIKINLSKLILLLIRDELFPPTLITKQNPNIGLFAKITDFIAENISKNPTLDDIAYYAGISKTTLKQLFIKRAGCGVCEYMIRMKMNTAKTYIREGNYNFTEIADILGYSTVHYFSAQFKKRVNMTPSEYANSIRALTAEAREFEP